MAHSELLESFREEAAEVLSGLEEGVTGLRTLSGAAGHAHDTPELAAHLGDPAARGKRDQLDRQLSTATGAP